MSEMGHWRTLEREAEMSALPAKADMFSVKINDRQVP
jgi:hypothetical protein